MTNEEQKKMGLTMIETLVEDLEHCRENGYLDQARDSFGRAIGVVMCMVVTGIISEDEEKELREELYRDHYVHE